MARGSNNKREKLRKYYDLFDKHGVDLGDDGIWEVQGTPVVKHSHVEKLGAALNIKYDLPTMLRSERDEAVIMVVGRLGERMEWSIGEALIVSDQYIGGNYKVSAKQPGYVYAMAEKRAKDRVILKLADMHGEIYSEEEADDFKEAGRGNGNRSSSNDNRPNNDRRDDDRRDDQPDDRKNDRPEPSKTALALTDGFGKSKSIGELRKKMDDKLSEINKLPADDLNYVRTFCQNLQYDLKQAANG
jgi:hypothetical protein